MAPAKDGWLGTDLTRAQDTTGHLGVLGPQGGDERPGPKPAFVYLATNARNGPLPDFGNLRRNRRDGRIADFGCRMREGLLA